MAVVNSYLSIITLNGLNFPVKRYEIAEWIKKKNKTQPYTIYKNSL